MPGLTNTWLYRVYKTEPDSRREELEYYEEPGTSLPHCLQYRTHVLRSYYPEVVLSIMEELGVQVASWSLIKRNPYLDIIQFEGNFFCILKLEVDIGKVHLRLHVYIS